ncbi:cell division protein FtsL [Treponema endosymbiont of Eucomonympha sp.]|uniref:cell division protein FtsL n=1 Tax=Treponema endosymbiont of Eucomonympha sp. TaxID=1580831 RepID=UPI000AA78EE0|nr:cell division protein FtsL [Treponema endosymbiont of Eucomonympha sp.]
MKRKHNILWLLKSALLCVMVISVPTLLMLAGTSARRSQKLEAEINRLEKWQTELVESNRKLITEISLQANSDRVERIASKELGMKRAETSDIIRIEMKR